MNLKNKVEKEGQEAVAKLAATAEKEKEKLDKDLAGVDAFLSDTFKNLCNKGEWEELQISFEEHLEVVDRASPLFLELENAPKEMTSRRQELLVKKAYCLLRIADKNTSNNQNDEALKILNELLEEKNVPDPIKSFAYLCRGVGLYNQAKSEGATTQVELDFQRASDLRKGKWEDWESHFVSIMSEIYDSDLKKLKVEKESKESLEKKKSELEEDLSKCREDISKIVLGTVDDPKDEKFNELTSQQKELILQHDKIKKEIEKGSDNGGSEKGVKEGSDKGGSEKGVIQQPEIGGKEVQQEKELREEKEKLKEKWKELTTKRLELWPIDNNTDSNKEIRSLINEINNIEKELDGKESLEEKKERWKNEIEEVKKLLKASNHEMKSDWCELKIIDLGQKLEGVWMGT